jgi:hypothetical protein
MPLHASFTPTRPLLTRIKLPSTCAGVPSSIAVSAATRATTRIKPWITGASSDVGQGTAAKMNATGNAKWHSHVSPPAHQITKIVKPTTTAAWTQASSRHSGFAISKSRTGSNASSAAIAIASAAEFATCDLRFAVCAGGRSCQRSQKRYGTKNGTNQPKLYCSLTDHSPLSSLQSPNHRAAKNKPLSTTRARKCVPASEEALVSLCGLARPCTGRELTKSVRKANRESFAEVGTRCLRTQPKQR